MSIGSGFSESLKPIIEWLPGQLESMEEQKQQFQDSIVQAPAQHAFVASPGQGSELIKTLNVPDEIVSQKRVHRIVTALNETSPYHRLFSVADAENIKRNQSVEEYKDEETGWG
jgi:hypothetical protein